MLPEENLKLPGMVLLFYKDGDWQYGQNIWRRWILEHNYMRETGERDFFENVLVNCENEAVKENRYALLKQIQDLFLHIADISVLQK